MWTVQTNLRQTHPVIQRSWKGTQVPRPANVVCHLQKIEPSRLSWSSKSISAHVHSRKEKEQKWGQLTKKLTSLHHVENQKKLVPQENRQQSHSQQGQIKRLNDGQFEEEKSRHQSPVKNSTVEVVWGERGRGAGKKEVEEGDSKHKRVVVHGIWEEGDNVDIFESRVGEEEDIPLDIFVEREAERQICHKREGKDFLWRTRHLIVFSSILYWIKNQHNYSISSESSISFFTSLNSIDPLSMPKLQRRMFCSFMSVVFFEHLYASSAIKSKVSIGFRENWADIRSMYLKLFSYIELFFIFSLISKDFCVKPFVLQNFLRIAGTTTSFDRWPRSAPKQCTTIIVSPFHGPNYMRFQSTRVLIEVYLVFYNIFPNCRNP